MNPIKKITYFELILGISLAFLTQIASSVQVTLDLEGTGQSTLVNLPFEYYKPQQNDHFTLIQQGGYKVYDLAKDKNEVAVIGPLAPCIGIAATDGKKFIVFHKHYTNALKTEIQDSAGSIVKNNLDLSSSNINNVRIRIFTTQDDVQWEQLNMASLHGGKNLQNALKDVIDEFEKIGIPRKFIFAEIYDMRDNKKQLKYPDGCLGKYEWSEKCIAIRINDILFQDPSITSQTKDRVQIKFTSIDPMTEDVFGFKETTIAARDFLGEKKIKELKTMLGSQAVEDQLGQTMQYEDIEKTCGYQLQRGYYERKIQQQKEALYRKKFGIDENQFLIKFKYSYCTCAFYLIDSSCSNSTNSSDNLTTSTTSTT